MVTLTVGDPAPWFTLPSTSSPHFHFNTVGGHRTVLFFFGTSTHANSLTILKEFCDRQAQFAELDVPFFGFSIDPEDTYLGEVIENLTYCKFMWDFEGEVSRLYGVYQGRDRQTQYTPTTFILNENLQVIQILPVEAENVTQHVDRVFAFLNQLPPPADFSLAGRQAPVLLIPQVFEPAFCRSLINRFEANGGQDSGFMRERDGKTVEVYDYSFKKRRDFNLTEAEPDLIETVNELILRRVKPEIEKVFQFTITRFERHVVACYEAEHQGFFNRHRDNTTKGTAHRRFAMTLNLNTGEYDGGFLWFPEYGRQVFRPNVGEAVVFSCSLLHEVIPVTRGRRFALLSFFYDDEDAKLRSRNQKYLELNPKQTPTQSKPGAKEAQPSLGFQPAAKKKRR